MIVCDLPPSYNQDPLNLLFFAKNRGFTPGPAQLAAKFKIPLQSYYAYTKQGEIHLELGPRRLISKPEDACDVYQFLLNAIERQPEEWWAADLLPLFPSNT